MDTSFPESVSPAEGTLSAQPTSVEPRPVSKGFTTLYALAGFTSNLAFVPPTVLTLPLKLQQIDPAHKTIDLSIILGSIAFVGLVLQPIIGQLSDRTTSRFGMRRPWMITGIIGTTIGLCMVGFATHFSVLLAGMIVATVSFNLMPLSAILPDQVPEQQRGSVSGIYSMAGIVGSIAGIVIATILGSGSLLSFAVPALIALVFVLLFALTLPDRRLAKENSTPFHLLAFVRGFWISPRRYPDFGWAWAGRFLIVLGLAMFTNYQVYFFIDHLHIPASQVSGLVALLSFAGTVCTILASIGGGILSDRFKRRKIFVLLASLIYAVGILIVAFAPSIPVVFVGGLIGSLAIGTYYAVDVALVTDVLPNKETQAAKGMGIFNIAINLPNSLAPAIAPLFLVIGGGNNYTVLYIAAALIVGLGALTIRPIKGVR